MADAEKTFSRKFARTEIRLITSKAGFIGLGMIQDTIRTDTKEELETYLNSESRKEVTP